MIPGGSNDERLTNVDTHNCYICKVAQYLASHEALLCAFMHVLVVYVHTLQIDFGFKIINAHFAHSSHSNNMYAYSHNTVEMLQN